MSIRQRIMSGLAANAFGQAVTIGSQLLLTPLFFVYWGAERYGEWLLLASIPAYFAMADLGMGSAAGNEMTMLVGQGRREAAQATFKAVGRIAAWALLAVSVTGVLLATCISQFDLLSIRTLHSTDAFAVVSLLAFGIGLGFINGIYFAGFRCAGYNALGITFGNMTRMLEALSTALLLWSGKGALAMATVMIVLKLTSITIQHALLQRLCVWLFHPRIPADPDMFRRLIKPSLGFLAMPLANALVLQGPVMIIGVFLGPAAVAAFSTMRTLSRLPIQASGVLNHSVWPEISRAWGQRDLLLVRLIHARTWTLTLVVVLSAGATLIFAGEWLMRAWLHKADIFDQGVMTGLILVASTHALWNVSGVVLAAINNHVRMGFGYVMLNALALLAVYLSVPSAGMAGVLAPLFLLELVMLLQVLPHVLRLLAQSPMSFARGIVSMAPAGGRPGA